MITMRLDHRVLWFTGLPCSGKTTLSEALRVELENMGKRVVQIDGDKIRQQYPRPLGFSREDRMANVRFVVDEVLVGKDRGDLTLVSVIAPYRIMRDHAKERIPGLIEVYVRCPLEVCEARDVKGMYRLARQGKIQNFTGISDVYEAPQRPDLVLDTDLEEVHESVQRILRLLYPQQASVKKAMTVV